MKSRCSFILKAGLALVLCFILLFGTMSTGLAAIRDDLAVTGANNRGWSYNASGWYVYSTFSGFSGTSVPLPSKDTTYNTSKTYTFYLEENDDPFYFKFYDSNSSKYVNPDTSGVNITSAGSSNTDQNSSAHSYAITRSDLDAGFFYSATVDFYLEGNNGYGWIELSNNTRTKISKLSPTLSVPASGHLNEAITLTGSYTAGNLIGAAVETYEYSTDGETWTTLDDNSYTATEEGTVYFRYSVKDNGISANVNAANNRIETTSGETSCLFTDNSPHIYLDSIDDDKSASLSYCAEDVDLAGHTGYTGSVSYDITSVNLSSNISVTVGDTDVVSLSDTAKVGSATLTKNSMVAQTITLYPTGVGSTSVTLTSGTKTNTITVTVTQYDPYHTLYYVNDLNWSAVAAYIYETGSPDVQKNGAWPGEAMTKVGTNSAGKDVYGYRVLKTITFNRVIFNNNNGGSQTNAFSCTGNGEFNSTDVSNTITPTAPTGVTFSSVEAKYQRTNTATFSSTNSTQGAYFVSGSNAVATVPNTVDNTAATSHTVNVTGVSVGDTTLYAYIYPASCVGITSFVYTAKAAEIVGYKYKTNVTVGQASYISSFEVDDESNTTIGVGDTAALTAAVKYTTAVTYHVYTDAECTISATSGTQYTITSNTVAGEAASATFTGLQTGDYYIKAEATDGTQTYLYADAVHVTVNVPTISVTNLDNQQVGATITPACSTTNIVAGSITGVTYAYANASNHNVVTISGDGRNITGAFPGTVTLKATLHYSGGTSDSANFTVTVKAPTLNLSYNSTSVDSSTTKELFKNGRTATLVATLSDVADGFTDFSVTYSYTSAGFSIVNASGEESITSKTATITSATTICDATNVTATLYIGDVATSVTNTYLSIQVVGESLSLSENTVTLYTDTATDNTALTNDDKGRDYITSKSITITNNAKDAYNTRIDIRSSDTSVATVDITTSHDNSSQALLISRAASPKVGTATITVEYRDVTNFTILDTKTITVKVENYKKDITIYFDTRGANIAPEDAIYVYAFDGGASSGHISGTDSTTSMMKIGTNGNSKIFAQTFSKTNFLGVPGSVEPRAIVFTRHYSIDKTTKTLNVYSDGGGGDNNAVNFADYTYFYITDPSSDQNYSVSQANYGCLKPSAATISVDAAAQRGETKDFSISLTPATNYTGATIDGKYTLTQTNACVNFENVTGAMTSGSVTVPGAIDGIIPLTYTDLDTVTYTATVDGTVYYSASGILTDPIMNNNTKNYIGCDFTSPANMTVTANKSTVTTASRKMDTTPVGYDTYEASTSYSYDGTDISWSGSSILYGSEITLTAADKTSDGYKFVGFIDSASAPTEWDSEVNISLHDVTLDTGVYSYTFTNKSIAAKAYNYYALYKKTYQISTFTSYHYNSDSETYQEKSGPPKTVIVESNKVKTTYTYNSEAESATPNGTYGAAQAITVAAGDSVKLMYPSLASSDAITTVWFDNTNTYNPGASTPEAPDRYEMTADNSGLDFADANHAIVFIVGKGNTAPIENTESTGTAGYDRLRITVEIGVKHRITFKDKTGYSTSTFKLGGYYVEDEDVSFGVTNYTGADKKAIYYLGTPAFYHSDGKTAYDSAPLTVGGSGNNLTFSGKMPAGDIVIDLGITCKYAVHFKTLIISDVAHNKTGQGIDTSISTITGTNKNGDSIIETDATGSTGPSTTSDDAEYQIDPDDYATFTYTEPVSGYKLIGWFLGSDTSPDYSEETTIDKEKRTITVFPNENITVWLVVTADMFIAARPEYLTEGAEASESWVTQIMDYDEDTGFYTYELTDAATTKTSGASSNTVLFKVLNISTIGGEGAETSWSSIGEFKRTANQMDYKGITFGRDGTSDKNGYCEDLNTADGYGGPITIKFKPASSSILLVEAKAVKPHLYLSEGYHGIFTDDSSSTYKISIETDHDSNGTYDDSGDNFKLTKKKTHDKNSETANEGDVYDYLVDIENCPIKITKTVAEGYQVSAFLIYNVTKRTVTSVVSGDTGFASSGNAYSYSFTYPDRDYRYIIPIIEMTQAKATELEKKLVTVKFDASQLNKTEWGDLVSCYAWYQNSGGDANGAYPGQLMIPNKDASEWTATFLIEATGAAKEIEGITFANYYDGTSKTWIGRSDVTKSGDVESSFSEDVNKIIPIYNHIQRSSNASYNRYNFKAQTYDYREPIAMYENMDPSATKLELSFSIKKGNDSQGNIVSWKHTELTADSANVLNYIVHAKTSGGTSTEFLKESDFEYLTDSAGNVTDFTGKILDDNATPSFYIVDKGLASYHDSKLKYVFGSGSSYQTGVDSAPGENQFITSTYTGAGEMKYASQWYIYDASGNYITDTLSAAYCEKVSDENTTRRIVKILTDLGYVVDHQAVAICYDNPRSCNGDSGGVPAAGNSFDCYRFIGQWYATTDVTPVRFTVEVGLKSNTGYVYAESHTASYGTASAEYNYTKMKDLGQFDSSDDIGTDAQKSYVRFPSKRSPYGPVTLIASSQDFIGWYTKNSAGKLELKSSSPELVPVDVTINTTYYAIYELNGKYIFKYEDRYGNVKSYKVSKTLNADEIAGYSGNNYQPGVPTFLWTDDAQTSVEFSGSLKSPLQKALDELEAVVEVYRTELTWPDTEQTSYSESGGITYNRKDQSVTVTATAAPEKFEFHYTIKKTGGVVDASVSNISYDKVITFNPVYNGSTKYQYINYDVPEENFSYWSLDNAGTQILTTNRYFGMRMSGDKFNHVYAQYNMTPSSPWVPYIEDATQTRIIDADNNSDKLYADYSANYINTEGNSIHDLTGIKYGIIIIKSPETDDTVDINYVMTAYNLLCTNNKNAAYIGDTSHIAYKFEYDDNEHISNFNRALFSISSNYSSMVGKKLTALVYLKDESGVIHYASAIDNSICVAAPAEP